MKLFFNKISFYFFKLQHLDLAKVVSLGFIVALVPFFISLLFLTFLFWPFQSIPLTSNLYRLNQFFQHIKEELTFLIPQGPF